MAYGTLKVDTIVYTSNGVDTTTTISGLANGTFANVTSTGTISGITITGNTGQFTTLTAATGIFTSRVSGATITGNTGQFTNITGNTAGFTTITGITVTGTNIGVGSGITFPDETVQTTAAVTVANVATTTGIQTFTAAQRGAVVVVPYATGISLNFSSGNNFQITLTGNTTLQNPTNIVSGQAGVITVIQGTASNTMAFSTGWQYPGGSGSTPTITATSGAVDLLVYYTKDTSSVSYRLVQNVKA